jgi:hypothetical protein
MRLKWKEFGAVDGRHECYGAPGMSGYYRIVPAVAMPGWRFCGYAVEYHTLGAIRHIKNFEPTSAGAKAVAQRHCDCQRRAKQRVQP